MDRLGGQALLGLHLRADDERDRRPARAAAHGRAQRGPAGHRLHGVGRCGEPALDGHLGIRPGQHPAGAGRPRLDARESAPPRPHPAPARRRRRSARARRAHRGVGGSAEARGPHPGGGDRRDRRRGRRDDAPAEPHPARGAREHPRHHDRGAHPLHGGTALRARPRGGGRGAGVAARELRGGDHRADRARRLPGARLPRPLDGRRPRRLDLRRTGRRRARARALRVPHG